MDLYLYVVLRIEPSVSHIPGTCRAPVPAPSFNVVPEIKYRHINDIITHKVVKKNLKK